jgi:hypothetical protein
MVIILGDGDDEDDDDDDDDGDNVDDPIPAQQTFEFLCLVSDIDYEGFPPWRQKIFLLVTHDYFDLAIAVVIGINVLCMAMEHYNQPEVLI